MSDLDIAVRKSPLGATLMSLTGILDARTCADLEAATHAEFRKGEYYLALDLSGLRILTSAGTAAILDALMISVEHSGNCVVVAPPPNVEEILFALGLTPAIPVTRTFDDAHAHFYGLPPPVAVKRHSHGLHNSLRVSEGVEDA